MNGIKGTNPAGIQLNPLLDEVVTILKYNKITIDHAIYIKVLSDWTLSCLTVSSGGVLNATDNDTAIPEIIKVFGKRLRLKYNKYMYLSTLTFGFSRLLLVSVLIILIT